jgi:hypothetical protein
MICLERLHLDGAVFFKRFAAAAGATTPQMHINNAPSLAQPIVSLRCVFRQASVVCWDFCLKIKDLYTAI